MSTPAPVIVERGGGGGFPVEGFLFFIIVGIIGIVFWLAWMYFKYRNKNTDVLKVTAPSAPVSSESHLLGITLTKAGEWDIRVKGQRYRTLEAVPDEQTRKQVVAALKELVGFSRGYIQKEPSASPAATAEPIAPPLSMPSLSRTASPATEPARPAASVAPPVAEPVRPAPSVSAPRLRLTGEPELRRTTAPAVLMPTIDLAREVGDILTEMQPRHPDLRNRAIKLLNAPSGGIEFNVDGFAYGSLDEIPDPAVRDLIQAAIKEWERR
ncbi:MAG: hypothetical protein JXA21_07215 [Anaerolineae bacterium]|nr:hypothetical protein [Anaerolineae bacterium]